MSYYRGLKPPEVFLSDEDNDLNDGVRRRALQKRRRRARDDCAGGGRFAEDEEEDSEEGMVEDQDVFRRAPLDHDRLYRD